MHQSPSIKSYIAISKKGTGILSKFVNKDSGE